MCPFFFLIAWLMNGVTAHLAGTKYPLNSSLHLVPGSFSRADLGLPTPLPGGLPARCDDDDDPLDDLDSDGSSEETLAHCGFKARVQGRYPATLFQHYLYGPSDTLLHHAGLAPLRC
jgi:hypothetical protein